MIVGNFRSINGRNKQIQNQFGVLKLQSDLNQYYKKAQKKAANTIWVEPARPIKPKDQMTLEDIREELQRKLAKYMLNNEELVSFLNSLQQRNSLDDMHNVVDKFINDYLVGASRLRASQMNQLLNVFIARKLKAEQPVVIGSGSCRGSGVPMVKSKYLSAGARQALIQSLRLAGNDAL